VKGGYTLWRHLHDTFLAKCSCVAFKHVSLNFISIEMFINNHEVVTAVNETRHFHDGEDLVCGYKFDTAEADTRLRTCTRNVVTPCFFDTMVTTYTSTRFHSRRQPIQTRLDFF
jgi:hypothetical protein